MDNSQHKVINQERACLHIFPMRGSFLLIVLLLYSYILSFLNLLPVFAYIEHISINKNRMGIINILMVLNPRMLKITLRIRSKATVNSILLTNLHRASKSYFSISSCLIVFTPATRFGDGIRMLGFLKRTKKPNIITKTTKIICNSKIAPPFFSINMVTCC